MFLGDSYISGSVHTQLMLFLMAMVWGAAIALAYDGLRVSRQLMPLPALALLRRRFSVLDRGSTDDLPSDVPI